MHHAVHHAVHHGMFYNRMFYTLPKLSHHAGDECRASLTRFYECALPPSGEGDVLDLCSSFTSHFPEGWRARPG